MKHSGLLILLIWLVIGTIIVGFADLGALGSLFPILTLPLAFVALRMGGMK